MKDHGNRAIPRHDTRHRSGTLATPVIAAAPTFSAPAGVGAGALTIAVHPSLDAAESDWRAIERHAVLTPYQRYDWLKALLASGFERPARVAIVIISLGGVPAGVLPLAIDRHFGFTQARLIGTAVSNTDWLAATPELLALLTPARLRALLAEIATAVGGIDLIRFFNLPARWGGSANPLLGLPHLPAPNNLYAGVVHHTALPYVDHLVPARRRGNIRRSARRLAEGFGPLELRRAATLAELERQHAAFLEQRAARFAEMGVNNIFAEPGFVRFFSSLAQHEFDKPRPALVFHALYAGSTIVATSCGSFAGNHYSHYINSMATGPSARVSVMSVLIGKLFDDLVTMGITSLDMGIGDFTYKTEWTTAEPLSNASLALTARGRLFEPLLDTGVTLKRTIKQNPRLWALAQQMRLALYRARHFGERG